MNPRISGQLRCLTARRRLNVAHSARVSCRTLSRAARWARRFGSRRLRMRRKPARCCWCPRPRAPGCRARRRGSGSDSRARVGGVATTGRHIRRPSHPDDRSRTSGRWAISRALRHRLVPWSSDICPDFRSTRTSPPPSVAASTYRPSGDRSAPLRSSTPASLGRPRKRAAAASGRRGRPLGPWL